ncbi:hypothetical protein [Mucilaginibacter lacusdianchii]|uniref:hypothetical protein n=1 Tax=Mucilaginibacter lacusdianchii TaxID=2684211 RepID=UPI00131D12D9|nr:hypothetical protein [Mucilaginibacter sp. JXJ CY 39]
MNKRLFKLIFLDAMSMQDGQSALDLSPDDIKAYFIKAAKEHDKGLSIPFFNSDFFGVTNAHNIKWANSRLTAQPFKTFAQPLRLKHIYGNHKPLIYIACTGPELRAIKPFANHAKANKNWKYLELNTGHDAMITIPVELAEMLQSLK